MKMLFKHCALIAALGFASLTASAQDYAVPADAPAYIKRAIEAADRPADQKAIDSARKPAETLMLAQLKEGDHIAEITSFGQYYSAILSSAVGPNGKVDMYDMPYMESIQDSTKKGKAFSDAHKNTTYTVVHYNDIQLANNLDAVYNILYYHDLQPMKVDTGAMNKKILAALKPGGIYFIVDHKAEDGSGWRDAGTIHRMGKETIVKEIKDAGFELLTDSDLLANPQDDRSKMVFAAGTRRHTDQAVLVFRKPK